MQTTRATMTTTTTMKDDDDPHHHQHQDSLYYYASRYEPHRAHCASVLCYVCLYTSREQLKDLECRKRANETELGWQEYHSRAICLCNVISRLVVYIFLQCA